MLLVVVVRFEEGDEDFERDAFVDGEDELFAHGGESLHLLEALTGWWGVEPVGEGVEGGVESPRDLAQSLVRICERGEDVGAASLVGWKSMNCGSAVV